MNITNMAYQAIGEMSYIRRARYELALYQDIYFNYLILAGGEVRLLLIF